MNRYVLDFREIDGRQVGLVGGKGAHLGELCRMGGVRVPPGFCVTTQAYRSIVASSPQVDGLIDELSAAEPAAVPVISAELRNAIETIGISADVEDAIGGALARLGDVAACAVRSSATAEDLPSASFAGQHDSFLNVIGHASILQHVRRCWASLFTARAVAYRARNGFDHRTVQMAVVIQRMVFPHAAGVLFTADPLTGNRKVTTIEATPGLGEALVSGAADPDVYRVRGNAIISRKVGARTFEVRAARSGGTEQGVVPPERQREPVLNDAHVLQLEGIGRHVEAHFGTPQDIEWCLEGDVVTSCRPGPSQRSSLSRRPVRTGTGCTCPSATSR